jgi:hypothetical protein
LWFFVFGTGLGPRDLPAIVFPIPADGIEKKPIYAIEPIAQWLLEDAVVLR